jgi:hypothetical protein
VRSKSTERDEKVLRLIPDKENLTFSSVRQGVFLKGELRRFQRSQGSADDLQMTPAVGGLYKNL